MPARQAVLLGGPFDGQGMHMADDRHPTIVLPLESPAVYRVADRGITGPSEFGPAFKLARYRLVFLNIHAPDSNVDIYVFEGAD